MSKDRHDCSWCGSAASVEYGVCQVCLMEFPNEAIVLKLPLDGPRRVTIEDQRRAAAENR